MEQTIKTIITFLSGGVFGGVIVYFFKALYEHYLALSRSIEAIKITEFNKAAAAFHTEFADVVFYLRQNIELAVGDKKVIFDIINTKNLARYERAMILFEPFIESDQLTAFRDQWKNYKKYMQETENKKGGPANPANASPENDLVITYGTQINEEYLKYIEDLLKYAKRK